MAIFVTDTTREVLGYQKVQVLSSAQWVHCFVFEILFYICMFLVFGALLGRLDSWIEDSDERQDEADRAMMGDRWYHISPEDEARINKKEEGMRQKMELDLEEMKETSLQEMDRYREDMEKEILWRRELSVGWVRRRNAIDERRMMAILRYRARIANWRIREWDEAHQF